MSREGDPCTSTRARGQRGFEKKGEIPHPLGRCRHERILDAAPHIMFVSLSHARGQLAVGDTAVHLHKCAVHQWAPSGVQSRRRLKERV
eukprot:7128658-Prymnesium_polylepis.2